MRRPNKLTPVASLLLFLFRRISYTYVHTFQLRKLQLPIPTPTRYADKEESTITIFSVESQSTLSQLLLFTLRHIISVLYIYTNIRDIPLSIVLKFPSLAHYIQFFHPREAHCNIILILTNASHKRDR